MLLALEVEEEVMSQGIQVASKARKGKEIESPAPARRSQSWEHFKFSSVKPFQISDLQNHENIC